MDGSDNQGCGGSRGEEGSNPIGGTDDQNRDPQASMSSPTDDQKRNPQAVVSSPIDGTGDQNRDPHHAMVSSPIDGTDDQMRESLTIGISSSSPIGSTEGQKCEVDAVAVDSRDASINVQVAHGLSLHDVSAPAEASFGDVKSLLVHDTGLEPQEQHLLFKGQEKQDYELLHDAGVQDKSKLLLVEDAATREWRLQEQQKQEQFERACQAISHVHADVDKLEEQLSACEATAQSAAGCTERDLAGLSEMLVQELLKLDAVEADGEAKNSRKAEVMRVLQLDDTVDRLRRENVKPLLTKNQPPTTATEPPPSEMQTPPETKTLGNTEWENQPPTTATELPPTESNTTCE